MISIQHLITRLKQYPPGLNYAEALEAARLLEIFNETYCNNNSDTVIRSMSVTDAKRFDEFKKQQNG